MLTQLIKLVRSKLYIEDIFLNTCRNPLKASSSAVRWKRHPEFAPPEDSGLVRLPTKDIHIFTYLKSSNNVNRFDLKRMKRLCIIIRIVDNLYLQRFRD